MVLAAIYSERLLWSLSCLKVVVFSSLTYGNIFSLEKARKICNAAAIDL